MVALFRLLASFVADLFKPRHRLEAEILFLRHQLNIALRQRPARLPLQGSDRVLLVCCANAASPSVLSITSQGYDVFHGRDSWNRQLLDGGQA
jgi:hypothetical protein